MATWAQQYMYGTFKNVWHHRAETIYIKGLLDESPRLGIQPCQPTFN